MEFEDCLASLDKRLATLAEMLAELADIGLNVTSDLEKIGMAREELNGECLRAAFAGAFSDGKTSVAAGWLGRVEAGMKIDVNESSETLAIYRPEGLNGRCEIVDTPGLFGDKEKEDGSGKKVRYGEQTRLYLSRAHLIFYVVDATNPLKGSHADTIAWLLRDVGKLASTIFVINKMDCVAELDDDEEFDVQARIKTANLTDKLKVFAGLSEREAESLRIVCVAADPVGRGLQTWLKELGAEGYEIYSRMAALKALAAQILRETAFPELLARTGLDVLTDTVRRLVAEAEKALDNLNLQSDDLKVQLRLNRDQLDAARRDVMRASDELKDRLHELENDMLRQARTLEGRDLVVFLETEIGQAEGQDTGYKLRHKLTRECREAFGRPRQLLIEIDTKMSATLEAGQSMFVPFGGLLLEGVKHGLGRLGGLETKVLRDGILAARSFTGINVKFAPWGALKLANNIKTGAAAFSVGVEAVVSAVNSFMAAQMEKRYQEAIAEITKFVKNHFLPLYDILDDQAKTIEYFSPGLLVLEKELSNTNRPNG